MDKKVAPKNSNSLSIWVIIVLVLFVLNLLFIYLIKSEAKTIKLLRSELVNLEQDRQILESSSEIFSSYAKEIELVSKVFPNEESIPDFISSFEKLIQNNSDDKNLKFNTITPVKEQDKLYIPLTLTIKTDALRLVNFLGSLEKLNYMIHINSVLAKTPDGFSGNGEYIITLKLYVQNPFTNK